MAQRFMTAGLWKNKQIRLWKRTKEVYPCHLLHSPLVFCVTNPIMPEILYWTRIPHRILYSIVSLQECLKRCRTVLTARLSLFLSRIASIVAYGLSGSGKTSALYGSGTNNGFVQRFVSDLFEKSPDVSLPVFPDL